MKILKTTALFIDADNVRLTAIPQILEILMLEWTPIKMRAYGTQIGPRQTILRDHGVLPVEVIPVLPGKNSVDLVLMVELIHEIVETHGEATIGKLGAIINVRDPIFSPKRYGSASLSALLKRLSGFTLAPVKGEDGSVQDYEVFVNEH